MANKFKKKYFISLVTRKIYSKLNLGELLGPILDVSSIPKIFPFL